MTPDAAYDPQAALACATALQRPEGVLGWSSAQWSLQLRLARRTRLLGRLAHALHAQGLVDRLPALPRRHLLSELRASHWRTTALRWGLDRVGRVLADAAYPRVLLKGAAYQGQGLPIAGGRLPSDIDILVPRAALGDALGRLGAAGWTEPDLDEHDRRYYHEWSHEVPPLRHPSVRMELDLHHNIQPPLSRHPVDAGLLLARLQPSLWPGWQVLHPLDQILHCASHLFHDGDLHDRLRDLVDLDGMLRCFVVPQADWPALLDRARQLGLAESLALGLLLCARWLATPVPPPVLDQACAAGLPAWRRACLLPLLRAVLLPGDPDEGDAWTRRVAGQLLLARYQWQRLPLRLLLPHLWRKLGQRSADGPA